MYERSFVAKYKLVNISNEHVISLEVGGVSGQDIQFASFGPKGNQIVSIAFPVEKFSTIPHV